MINAGAETKLVEKLNDIIVSGRTIALVSLHPLLETAKNDTLGRVAEGGHTQTDRVNFARCTNGALLGQLSDGSRQAPPCSVPGAPVAMRAKPDRNDPSDTYLRYNRGGDFSRLLQNVCWRSILLSCSATILWWQSQLWWKNMAIFRHVFEPDRDLLRHARLLHRDAIERVCDGHSPLRVRDNDKLGGR